MVVVCRDLQVGMVTITVPQCTPQRVLVRFRAGVVLAAGAACCFGLDAWQRGMVETRDPPRSWLNKRQH